MAQTVIGFFENNLAAYKAVNGLTSRGMSASQIDITREEPTDTTDVEQKRDGENGFTRFFKNLFGDSEDAERYASVSKRGYTLVTVHAHSADEAAFAADMLDDFGAIDVDEYAGRTFNNGNHPQQDRNREASIQRIEEDIHIGKQREDRGGNRVRSRIVEKPVEENVRLREERIRVERNPVDRAATDADLQSFQEGNMELTERKEIPVVNKEARVVEEIRVHKDVEEHTETVHEKVRHTEVDIDKIGDNMDDDVVDREQNDRQTGRRSNVRDNVDDYDANDNRMGRRDGDPLFGA